MTRSGNIFERYSMLENRSFQLPSPESLEYDGEEEEEESSDEDEIQYCDCIAVTLSKSLPGTPGKKGFFLKYFFFKSFLQG